MVMVVLETERGRRVRRMALVVSVRAGGEAAGGSRSATVVWDASRPGASAWALLLATRTSQGGVEVTVLAAQSRRRGGGRDVALGQPLGVCDGCWGGNDSGGRGKIPQRAVLLDHAAVQALVGPVCLLDAVQPLRLLLNRTDGEVEVGVWSRH